MMNSLVPRSISLMLAVGIGCHMISDQAFVMAELTATSSQSSSGKFCKFNALAAN